MHGSKQRIGAFHQGNGNCEFNVWAPLAQMIEIVINEIPFELMEDGTGYWKGNFTGVKPGTRYTVRIDREHAYPDPASVSQPEGPHGASEVIDRHFQWFDSQWKGISRKDLIIYELHVGTFTPEGQFASVIPKLPYLKSLGITAIEIMPIAEFPGDRNWGYDGVNLFAPSHVYGGVQGLKQLVDAAHQAGIAVILDVVYNHLGPDGNYLNAFGPYFTQKYKTPWGEALNFDDAYCDGVRNFFIQNALMWLGEFHIDELRMDAVHAIFDMSAHHFIAELKEEVLALEKSTGSTKILIAEFDLNNPRYINQPSQGGYGLDGQWNDEFHHALHSLLTGEKDGYYEDYGDLQHLANAYQNTYVYNGIFSKHRHKIFGAKEVTNDFDQFVVFAQNHDHIGNRALGDRLTTTLHDDELRLAAAAVILSPYIPLLFMGEEYGEQNPFLYFINHNSELAEMVREGRKKEFAYFDFEDEFPDPQAEESFNKSKLSWQTQTADAATLLAFYTRLIEIRKQYPAITNPKRESLIVKTDEKTGLIVLERTYETTKILILMNFGNDVCSYITEEKNDLEVVLDASSWNINQDNTTSVAISSGSAVSIQPKSVVVLNKI